MRERENYHIKQAGNALWITTGKLLVLEVNSGVSTLRYSYRDVIELHLS